MEGFLHDAGLGGEPVVVRYSDPYLAWDYVRSSEMTTLRRDLFWTLQYRQSLLVLGRAVFDQMAGATGADARFIGVHLGEDEWAEVGAVGMEALIREYVEALRGIESPSTATPTGSVSAGRGDMKRRWSVGGNDATPDDYQIRTVFVSCRDMAVAQKFREMLQPFNYTVYDTRTLLALAVDVIHHHQKGNETLLAQIEALGPDQRYVVEYEVLVRARYWLGVSTSPLSTLIAHARGDPGITEEAAMADWFEKYVYPHSADRHHRRQRGASRVRAGYGGPG